MHIVFDEVSGVVADSSDEEKAGEKPQPQSSEATPTATPDDLLRNLRLIAERKARLIAD